MSEARSDAPNAESGLPRLTADQAEAEGWIDLYDCPDWKTVETCVYRIKAAALREAATAWDLDPEWWGDFADWLRARATSVTPPVQESS